MAATGLLLKLSCCWKCSVFLFFIFLNELSLQGAALPRAAMLPKDILLSTRKELTEEQVRGSESTLTSSVATKHSIETTITTTTTSTRYDVTNTPTLQEPATTQDPNRNLIIIFDTNVTNIGATTRTTIITTTASTDCTRNCCSLGRMAGRKGYLCIALPNFSRIFNTLLHPYKVKRTRRPNVMWRGIERCARHPSRKRLYEQCCEESQQLLRERNERIKECEYNLGQGNCNHLHHRTVPDCY